MKLNRAKDYYENDKVWLREKARNKYTELPNKERNIKREHRRNMNRNMPKEKKDKD